MAGRSSAFERLRVLAEDILKNGQTLSEPNTDVEFKEVLHELHVYQIELEIQNEALRQAQDKLAESRREFSNLFEHAPVAYFTVGPEGVIVRANDTAARKFDCAQADLQGKPFAQLVEMGARDAFYFFRRELQKNREPQTGEFIFIRPDGSTFHGQLEGAVVDPDGTDNTFRAAITDITPIKEAEAALQQSLQQKQELNALRSRLIEVISHELRTPLSVILTTVHLLESYTDPSDEVRRTQLHERIRTSVWYLNDMVHDVVAAHRSGDETPELKTTAFDVIPFVRQLVGDISAMSNRPDRIRFSVQNAHDVERVVWDQRLSRLLFTNLLQNAIKYSDAAIMCKLICEENAITVHVEDQGAGIPVTDQPRIFEMFYRGGNTVSISGTGVGLAVVKSAVEAQRGTIHFVTGRDGTTFTVRLPRSVQGEESRDS